MDPTTSAHARHQKATPRRRYGDSASIVAFLVAVLFLVVDTLSKASPAGPGPQRPASPAQAAAVAAKVTSLTPGDLAEEVRATPAPNLNLPTRISGPALHLDGKPEILYIGAEWCPFCATERWALVAALSKFGTFSKLGLTHSSSTDVDKDTQTFTFHGATYRSPYLAFAGFEQQANSVVGSSYAPLDKVPARDLSVMARVDAPPYQQQSGGIPFLDLGGRLASAGAAYSPQVLHGLSALQIATDLHKPSSLPAKAIGATAGDLVSQLCQLTHDRPAGACTVLAAAPGGPRGKQRLG